MARPPLEVRNLTTGFFADKGLLVAGNGVSFHVNPGETVST